MTCKSFTKDPSGKRRVVLDFSDWLGTGPTIASVAWTVPSGITEPETPTNTTTTATNWFSGGTDGQEYEIKCCITTDDSPTRIKCESFILKVESNC